jgi:hypothetical protein
VPRALSKTDSGVPRAALPCAAVITPVAAVWAARHDGPDRPVSVVGIGALTAFTPPHASVVAARRSAGLSSPLRGDLPGAPRQEPVRALCQ